jgi:hypothetical protein
MTKEELSRAMRLDALIDRATKCSQVLHENEDAEVSLIIKGRKLPGGPYTFEVPREMMPWITRIVDTQLRQFKAEFDGL